MHIIIDDVRSLEQVGKLVRLPKTYEGKPVEWDIFRSYKGFKKFLLTLDKPPVFISFDHDLGHVPEPGQREEDGVLCAKILIEHAIEKHWTYLPKWVVPSSNPPGKKNIEETLKGGERYLAIRGEAPQPNGKKSKTSTE